MTDPLAFVRELRRAGFGIFSGVPCSYLTPLINTVIDSDEVRYIAAANEGDAVAIACGAELGGSSGVVMIQNSGFGNAVNPLSSLAATLDIPCLVIVTWRGHPEQAPDEPQHELMGRITPRLLELLEIPWELFPDSDAGVRPMLDRARAHMARRRTPYGLILQKGSVDRHDLETRPDDGSVPRVDAFPGEQATARLDPDDVLRAIQTSARDSDVVLATTGYTGRALFALEDRPNQLYMVGSMGCVASLGLGLAVAQPGRRVIAVDGDGAVLMRMGALATIGRERPGNLIHIVLDNAVYESTGSQGTGSQWVDFVGLARSAGYPEALRIGDCDVLRAALRADARRLRFLHVRTKPRESTKLPRPTLGPAQVARRLRAFLGVEA